MKTADTMQIQYISKLRNGDQGLHLSSFKKHHHLQPGGQGSGLCQWMRKGFMATPPWRWFFQSVVTRCECSKVTVFNGERPLRGEQLGRQKLDSPNCLSNSSKFWNFSTNKNNPNPRHWKQRSCIWAQQWVC